MSIRKAAVLFKDLPGVLADFFLLEFVGPEVGIQRGLVELIHGFHAHQQFSPRGPTARQKWLHLIAIAINQAGADAQDFSGLTRRQPCVAIGSHARRFGSENNTAVPHADHFGQHGNDHLPAPGWRRAACLRAILRHHLSVFTFFSWPIREFARQEIAFLQFHS